MKKKDRIDKVWTWIAWKLPRGLVYWSAIRLMASATQGQWSDAVAPELLAMDALKRWGKGDDRR